MRDLLTVLAGLVVLVLAAALTLPPLVSWEGQRGAVDRALARATGLEASTEGRIGLRLLPSPRLSVDALHLGGGEAGPSLDARGLEAEVALAPLLQGVLHFTEARATRAEVKLSVTGDGRPVLFGVGGLRPPDLAVEDLRIGELLLTRVTAATGRTDQVVAQDVHATASALAGPWQVEGSHDGAPFRLTTGSVDAAGTLPLKLEAGGDTAPRLEVDARVSLPEGGGMPSAVGGFKLVVGPPSQAAGPYVPFVIQGKLATQGALVRLDALVLDVDQGGAALRLNGRGGVDLATATASLVLDARRLDLDAFLLSPAGHAFLERRGTGLLPPLPIDLTLGVESANLVAEEWTALGLEARLDPDGAVTLRRLAATAPGGARLQAEGEAGIGPSRSFTGHVSLSAPQPARLARMLERVGVSGPIPLLDAGRPLALAGDVTLAPPVMALRNARLALGEARITGNARYTGSEAGGGRGRFDAQVSAQGVDVADLPPLRDLATGLGGLDLGLALVATDLRYGPAGAGARGGRLTADIRSEGTALRIDALELTNLAGANARASGRIAPDGTGRIAGRVTAPRAAPLLDLASAAWGGLPRRLPAALRDGALDLEVSAERAGDAPPRLALTANGRAAGATVRADLAVAEGRAETFALDATTPDASIWLGRPGDAALAKPGTLRLAAARREGRITLEGQGTLAEMRLATAAPLTLNPDDGLPDAGALTFAGADAAPFAALFGEGVRVPAPLPVDLRLGFARAKDAPLRLTLAGRAAEASVEADLTRSGEAITGTLALDRLALPRLLDALALSPEPEARAAPGPWPTARFRVARPVFAGEVAVKATTLDLGRGLIAREARFTLASNSDALVLRDASARLGDGQLSGTLSLARQEGQVGLSGEARVENLALATLTGVVPPAAPAAARALEGRLSGRLRFGASGVSAAALVANLAGEGEVRLAGLRAPGGDPGGLSRTVARLMRDDDPLRAGRTQDVAAEELSRGPLRVAAEASAPALLVGGSLRMAPLVLDLGPADPGPASWQGTASYDLRASRLDARGTLALREAPRGWTGPPPALVLGYAGPLADPVRSLDAAPLTTGLAAVVLKRELDTIELYEEDASERLRRQRRHEMDRARDAEAARRAAEAARAAQGAVEAAPAQP